MHHSPFRFLAGERRKEFVLLTQEFPRAEQPGAAPAPDTTAKPSSLPTRERAEDAETADADARSTASASPRPSLTGSQPTRSPEPEDNEGADTLAGIVSRRKQSLTLQRPQQHRRPSVEQLADGTFVSQRGSIIARSGAVAESKNQYATLQRTRSRADRIQEAEAAVGQASGGKIVLYTTSMQAVQATYSRCLVREKEGEEEEEGRRLKKLITGDGPILRINSHLVLID